jgi:hypothetical protein
MTRDGKSASELLKAGIDLSKSEIVQDEVLATQSSHRNLSIVGQRGVSSMSSSVTYPWSVRSEDFTTSQSSDSRAWR